MSSDLREIELVQAWNVLLNECDKCTDEDRKDELISKMCDIEVELYNDFGIDML